MAGFIATLIVFWALALVIWTVVAWPWFVDGYHIKIAEGGYDSTRSRSYLSIRFWMSVLVGVCALIAVSLVLAYELLVAVGLGQAVGVLILPVGAIMAMGVATISTLLYRWRPAYSAMEPNHGAYRYLVRVFHAACLVSAVLTFLCR